MRNSTRRRRRTSITIALAVILPFPANALQSHLCGALVDTVTMVTPKIPLNSYNFVPPRVFVPLLLMKAWSLTMNRTLLLVPLVGQPYRKHSENFSSPLAESFALRTRPSHPQKAATSCTWHNLLARREPTANRRFHRHHCNICCRRRELGYTYIKLLL